MNDAPVVEAKKVVKKRLSWGKLLWAPVAWALAVVFLAGACRVTADLCRIGWRLAGHLLGWAL